MEVFQCRWECCWKLAHTTTEENQVFQTLWKIWKPVCSELAEIECLKTGRDARRAETLKSQFEIAE
jgi:hypothetical protein